MESNTIDDKLIGNENNIVFYTDEEDDVNIEIEIEINYNIGRRKQCQYK